MAKTRPMEDLIKEAGNNARDSFRKAERSRESVEQKVNGPSSIPAQSPIELTGHQDDILDSFKIPKKKESRDKHISVFVTQSTYQRLKRASIESGASVNGIINGLVEDFLNRFESAQKPE